MLEFIRQPWPWYVAGPLIVVVMYLLLYFGKKFGISSSFRTACSIGGAGKVSQFFNYNWREELWLVVFVAGTILGGVIASTILHNPEPIALSEVTVERLQNLGMENPGEKFLPADVFSWSNLLSLKGAIMLVLGGFLVGFGSRYAGGCTSGHAISGLSDLQIPSLIAVIGFFIGGLLISYLVLPGLLSS